MPRINKNGRPKSGGADVERLSKVVLGRGPDHSRPTPEKSGAFSVVRFMGATTLDQQIQFNDQTALFAETLNERTGTDRFAGSLYWNSYANLMDITLVRKLMNRQKNGAVVEDDLLDAMPESKLEPKDAVVVGHNIVRTRDSDKKGATVNLKLAYDSATDEMACLREYANEFGLDPTWSVPRLSIATGRDLDKLPQNFGTSVAEATELTFREGTQLLLGHLGLNYPDK